MYSLLIFSFQIWIQIWNDTHSLIWNNFFSTGIYMYIYLSFGNEIPYSAFVETIFSVSWESKLWGKMKIFWKESLSYKRPQFICKSLTIKRPKNGTSFKESIKLLRASINFAIKKMQTHLPYINQEPISNSQKPLLSTVFLNVPQFNMTKTEHQLYFAKSIYFN